MDLAISSFIITPKNLFQNIKKNIYNKISKILKIYKSVEFIKRIDQNKKLFISSVRFHKNQRIKIHPAIQAWEIISFVDSLVINLVFSMK